MKDRFLNYSNTLENEANKLLVESREALNKTERSGSFTGNVVWR